MVRLLVKFINSRPCASCTFYCDIGIEIEKFKCQNPGIKPTIVFDFNAFLAMFIKSNDEVICGGRYNVCQERMEKFLRKLKSMGTDLVFFADGPTLQRNIEFWVQRVNSKYREHCRLFECLKQGDRIQLDYDLYISSYLYKLSVRIAKKYGKYFVSVHNDCDIDCAVYATKIKAVAVVTMDADFLIMAGDWPIWVPQTLDLDHSTVQVWDKKELRRVLNLSESQMPIFSTLCGNDNVPFEMLEHFHGKMERRTKFVLFKIAKFIETYFPRGVPLSREEFRHLMNIVSNNRENCTAEKATKLINLSLAAYNYDDHKNPGIVPEWLKKHTEDFSSDFLYTLEKDLPIFFRQSFIDLSRQDVLPYFELALPIVRKQMGISDYHKSRNNLERIIYCKPNHEEPFQQRKIKPIFPDFEVPPLNVLLGYDVIAENIASLNDLRMEIFCWIISTDNNPVTPDVFQSTEKKAYIISSLVLTYLVREHQIELQEADAMLLSIREAMNSDIWRLENIKAPQIYEVRAFWLAHVFLRIRDLYFDSLMLCGLNEFLEYDAYDGFIFHKMYNKYILLDSNTQRLLREPIEDYRLYARIMP